MSKIQDMFTDKEMLERIRVQVPHQDLPPNLKAIILSTPDTIDQLNHRIEKLREYIEGKQCVCIKMAGVNCLRCATLHADDLLTK